VLWVIGFSRRARSISAWCSAIELFHRDGRAANRDDRATKRFQSQSCGSGLSMHFSSTTTALSCSRDCQLLRTALVVVHALAMTARRNVPSA